MISFADAVSEAVNELPKGNASAATIDNILSTVFVVLGAVSVLVIALGGVRYILSHGDTRIIEDSKNQIFYAIVGLLVALMAQAIAVFVIKSGS